MGAIAAMFERISQNSELNDVIGSSRLSSGDTPSSDRKDMIPKEIGDDTKESNKYKDADDNRKAEEPDPPKEIGEADTEKTGISEKIREKLLAGGMSEGVVNTCTQDKEGQVYLKEPSITEDTAKLYAKKVLDHNGIKVEGVFPKFESKFQCLLPENLYKDTDYNQMKYCTTKLAEAINTDPKLAKMFSPQQLAQIKEGRARITGLVWHHNEEKGVMQLVDSDIHSKADHIGGRAIWGGGSNYRL